MAEKKGNSNIILVADISPTVRRLMRGYLKDDYEVCEAESGKEVLSVLAERHACDSHCVKDAKAGGNASLMPVLNDSCGAKNILAIVMGGELPDGSAFDLTAKIRKKYHPKCLPVIISTSHNDRETIIEALDKGANDIIVKPFPRELILSKLRKLEHEIPLQDLQLSEPVAKIPFFAGVPVAQVAYILNTCSQTLDKEKGDIICEQDDTNLDLFILVEGKCSVVFNKRKVADITPIDTIGEMGFVANTKRSATVIAAAPSKVIVINKKKFEEYLNEERAISEMILKNIVLSLNDRIRKSNALINRLKVVAEEYLGE
ncbi:MAG: response regulator [Nitrospinae bacterium]|nr:response regulator [Nitrospinota bacterium]